MKTGRRHELQTNTLAQHLAESIEKIKPYSTAITVVVGAVIIVAIVAAYLAQSKSTADQAAWDKFTYAMTSYPPQIEGLELDLQDHAGTQMEEWSTLTLADYRLAGASGGFFRNREGKAKSLKKILDLYETLIAQTDSHEIRDRAQLGLARTHEMNGDLERAKKAYQSVQGLLSGIAEARLEELDRPTTAEAFPWLKTAKAIIPTAPTGPGTPGERPLFGTQFDLTPPDESTGIAPDTAEGIDLLEAIRQATEGNDGPAMPDGMPAIPDDGPAGDGPAAPDDVSATPEAPSETPEE